jgi:hypothetical protein
LFSIWDAGSICAARRGRDEAGLSGAGLDEAGGAGLGLCRVLKLYLSPLQRYYKR